MHEDLAQRAERLREALPESLRDGTAEGGLHHDVDFGQMLSRAAADLRAGRVLTRAEFMARNGLAPLVRKRAQGGRG